MPQTVTKHIVVNDLRVGDRVATNDDAVMPAVVTGFTRKQLWGLVTFDGNVARPRRLKLTEPITVLRDVPTDDEKAALRRELMVGQLRRDLRALLSESPLTLTEEIVVKARQDKRENVALFNWSNLADVLQTQALHGQGVALLTAINAIGSRVIEVASDVDDVGDEVLLDAFASWYHQNVEGDAYGPRHNPLSRSTSPLSNLLEDLDRWAVDTVMSKIHWAGAQDELARRVAAAQAKRKSTS